MIYGVTGAGSKSDSYSASVTPVMCAISCCIGPNYYGMLLHIESVEDCDIFSLIKYDIACFLQDRGIFVAETLEILQSFIKHHWCVIKHGILWTELVVIRSAQRSCWWGGGDIGVGLQTDSYLRYYNFHNIAWNLFIFGLEIAFREGCQV